MFLYQSLLTGCRYDMQILLADMTGLEKFSSPSMRFSAFLLSLTAIVCFPVKH